MDVKIAKRRCHKATLAEFVIGGGCFRKAPPPQFATVTCVMLADVVLEALAAVAAAADEADEQACTQRGHCHGARMLAKELPQQFFAFIDCILEEHATLGESLGVLRGIVGGVAGRKLGQPKQGLDRAAGAVDALHAKGVSGHGADQ
jgi:hypothetical protein